MGFGGKWSDMSRQRRLGKDLGGGRKQIRWELVEVKELTMDLGYVIVEGVAGVGQ